MQRSGSMGLQAFLWNQIALRTPVLWTHPTWLTKPVRLERCCVKRQPQAMNSRVHQVSHGSISAGQLAPAGKVCLMGLNVVDSMHNNRQCQLSTMFMLVAFMTGPGLHAVCRPHFLPVVTWSSRSRRSHICAWPVFSENWSNWTADMPDMQT